MAMYVTVRSGEVVSKFPLAGPDGDLNLEILNYRYPLAKGLLCVDDDGNEVVVPAVDGKIHPIEKWADVEYCPLIPHEEREGENGNVQSVLRDLLARPQTQLILAPEKKPPTFAGQVGEVADFVSSMRNAFARYAVPEGQRGAFLLDYLKDGPKAEVKSLVKEGKEIEELLSFLETSYSDYVPVGELQRLFLERRQKRRETVRDYAVDLEKRFLRLTTKDPKLYANPGATLAEQFLEGIEDLYLRNTLRDMHELKPTISFREIREFAIKREQQEEARARSSSSGTAHQAAVQMKVQSPATDPDVLQAVRDMADRVVGAVNGLAQSLYSPRGQPGQPRQSPTMRNPNRGPCYCCGAFGHFARECPHRGQGWSSMGFGGGQPMYDARGQEPVWAYAGDPYTDPRVPQGQHSPHGYHDPSMPPPPPPGNAGEGRAQDSRHHGAGGAAQTGPTQFHTGATGKGPTGRDTKQHQGQTPVTGRMSEMSAVAGHDIMDGFLSKAVGECFSVSVKFGSTEVPCLLDPGSQVTTVGETFFNERLEPAGFEVKEIPSSFAVVSASGEAIPYVGCFETDVCALGQVIESRVVLVIKDKAALDRGQDVMMGILGMNVLQDCWERLVKAEGRSHLRKIEWPEANPVWQKAFKAVDERLQWHSRNAIGEASLRHSSCFVVSARQAVLLEARSPSGPCGEPFEGFLEPDRTSGMPAGVTVQSCLVQVEEGRFPVVVCNENTEDVVLPKSVHLGTLYNAAVVRDVSPEVPAGEASQDIVGVDADWASLNKDDTEALRSLLYKHSDVFSAHDQDFGFTDKVTHRIDTGDAKPFRERHRPLPPAQYQAVRDHIQDLIQRGVVQESQRNGRFPHSLVLSGEGPARRRGDVKSYVHQHQMQLKTARAIAARNADAAAVARRALQARRVFEKPLGVGQYVLVRRHGLKGRAKIADYWEANPYMVVKQPFAGQPVYVVRSHLGKERVLHRTQLKHCPWLPEGTQEVLGSNPSENASSSGNADPCGYVIHRAATTQDSQMGDDDLSSGTHSERNSGDECRSPQEEPAGVASSMEGGRNTSEEDQGELSPVDSELETVRYPVRSTRGVPPRRYADSYLYS